MRAIVAIGGGDFKLGETVKIDKYIVDLCGKENPKLLFIPTASFDSNEYVDQIKDYFSHFGCYVDSLCLFSEYNLKTIRDKIMEADIIYVGGGDTTALINKWRELHVDTYLVEAYMKGTIISGLSAGAICWFNEGFVERNKDINHGQWCEDDAHCLGLVNGYCCPHYNVEHHEVFDHFIARNNQVGFGLEDNTALVKLDDEYFAYNGQDHFNVYVLKPHYNGLEKIKLGHLEKIEF